MDVGQAIVLGIVQGLTEFLPISSSGHLVLVQHLMGLAGPQLTFDVAVHVGTLAAVLVALRRELGAIAAAVLPWRPGRRRWSWAPPYASPPLRGGRLLWLIVVGTLPAALAGFWLRDPVEQAFASPVVPGVMLIVTGLLLWLADRRQTFAYRRQARHLDRLTTWDGVIIGVGQALAILPGLSRSGTTIAAGIWRGLSQEAAARYSFLLSIPAILGAAILETIDTTWGSLPGQPWEPLLIGAAAAAITGYLSIAWLLRFLQHGRLWPFALYTWAVGALVVYAIWVGGW